MLEGMTPRITNMCSLAQKRLDLEPADQSILDTALADVDTWAAHSLHFALKEKGFHVSKDLIIRHRRKLCTCWKI